MTLSSTALIYFLADEAARFFSIFFFGATAISCFSDSSESESKTSLDLRGLTYFVFSAAFGVREVEDFLVTDFAGLSFTAMVLRLLVG